MLFDHIIGACKQCVWQGGRKRPRCTHSGAANSNVGFYFRELWPVNRKLRTTWHPYPFQEEGSGSRWRALLRRKEAAN